MLDQSTVISKVTGGGPHRFLLSAVSPDIIVDGGSNGAVAAVPSGQVLTCQVDNSYTPTTTWLAVSGTQAIGAATRRAFRLADANSAPITIAFN